MLKISLDGQTSKIQNLKSFLSTALGFSKFPDLREHGGESRRLVNELSQGVLKIHK